MKFFYLANLSKTIRGNVIRRLKARIKFVKSRGVPNQKLKSTSLTPAKKKYTTSTQALDQTSPCASA